ncbi:hypothetical protein [Paenibacillus sp. FJAT-27812]|nr:hypothetical protein [Paenibacillus sp. FJAT-27812]
MCTESIVFVLGLLGVFLHLHPSRYVCAYLTGSQLTQPNVLEAEESEAA